MSSHFSQIERYAEKPIVSRTKRGLKKYRPINKHLEGSPLETLKLISSYTKRKKKKKKRGASSTYLVANKGHASIVGPGKVGDGSAAVVYQLDAPPTVVLYPYEYYSRAVARGELLIRLVPLYQYHLRGCQHTSKYMHISEYFFE